MFFWYSFLMHMSFMKADYFGKYMELIRESNGESMPVQTWPTVISKDRDESNYILFDDNFASRLRARLVLNPQRIPTELLDFLWPKERRSDLNIEHNWGDIIPCRVCTVIRVYGFLDYPFLLTYHVTLRLGFLLG